MLVTLVAIRAVDAEPRQGCLAGTARHTELLVAAVGIKKGAGYRAAQLTR
jgi:hypothetical protein